MGKLLGTIGAVLTLCYLGFWAWVLQSRWKALAEMPLNNIGDFLGGAFGPLALLWLVLGYFQQGIELRQNSAALKLQADELRHAAEHAAALVDVARKDHELAVNERTDAQRRSEAAAERQRLAREEGERRRIQPSFRFSTRFDSSSSTTSIVQVTNRGHECSDLSLEVPDADLVHMEKAEGPLLQPHDSFDLVFRFKPNRFGTTPLVVKYTDTQGAKHVLNYIAALNDGEVAIEEPP